MHRQNISLPFVVLFAAVGTAAAGETEEGLSEHLKAFAPYVGKTWNAR